MKDRPKDHHERSLFEGSFDDREKAMLEQGLFSLPPEDSAESGGESEESDSELESGAGTEEAEAADAGQSQTPEPEVVTPRTTLQLWLMCTGIAFGLSTSWMSTVQAFSFTSEFGPKNACELQAISIATASVAALVGPPFVAIVHDLCIKTGWTLFGLVGVPALVLLATSYLKC